MSRVSIGIRLRSREDRRGGHGIRRNPVRSTWDATAKFDRPQVMNAIAKPIGNSRTRSGGPGRTRPFVWSPTGEGRGFCSGDDVNQIFLAEPDNSDEARSRRLLEQTMTCARTGVIRHGDHGGSKPHRRSERRRRRLRLRYCPDVRHASWQ